MQKLSSDDPTDNLLASLERELQGKQKKEPFKGNRNTSIDEALSSLRTDLQSQHRAGKAQPQPLVNLELEELERQLQQRQQEQITPLELQNIETIRNQELDKQRRQNLLIRRAEQWLKNLNPHSDEGLWFEQFSYGYESRLAAAIDYLQGLDKKI
jgi:hypothetical protein